MTAKGCTRKEVAILFIDNNNNLKGNLLAGLKLVEVQSQDVSFIVVLIVEQRRKAIISGSSLDWSCDNRRCHHHHVTTL
jgi:hypothetical protein